MTPITPLMTATVITSPGAEICKESFSLKPNCTILHMSLPIRKGKWLSGSHAGNLTAGEEIALKEVGKGSGHRKNFRPGALDRKTARGGRLRNFPGRGRGKISSKII